ncbi:MAG TPA: zinc-binding dehydrogenase [Candidatus Binataceae bacterium]|nr:zinc-binding dehydrogenase [Candidatus Binataceae bacterium]
MRAAVMRNKTIVVDDVPAPEPGPGEVLVKSLACGICGTDLHALKHAETMIEVSRRTGGAFDIDLARDLVFGHEFCAELVDYGPATTRKIKTGARICSMPLILRAGGAQTVGLSSDHPGAYGQYMRLTESLLLEVPNGLATEHAALTEPMAVGLHAVAKAHIEGDEVPLVLGCGPVGLAVVAALKLKGIEPVVAADFSPRRRELARTMGADVVVDPRRDSPFESWKQIAVYKDPAKGPKFEPPIPYAPYRPAVIFECVGAPGIVSAIMVGAPSRARIIVVGLCLEPDTYEPFFGISKELNLQFAIAYNGAEFAATLHNIAEGELKVEPLITGHVGLAGVAGAFEELASPERHAKILVNPWKN